MEPPGEVPLFLFQIPCSNICLVAASAHPRFAAGLAHYPMGWDAKYDQSQYPFRPRRFFLFPPFLLGSGWPIHPIRREQSQYPFRLKAPLLRPPPSSRVEESPRPATGGHHRLPPKAWTHSLATYPEFGFSHLPP